MKDNGGRGRREQVLEVLRASGTPLRVIDLARRLGVHPNTVRFHLTALARRGLVEAVAPTPGGRGRPSSAYRPVSAMDPDGPREYRALAQILGEDLASRSQPTRRAVGIGRRWGRRVALESDRSRARTGRESRRRMLHLMDRLGFAPDARSDSDRIELRSCPFLELATASTRVVCPIHLGLMQGALETWRAPVTVERLEPFARPDLCLAHLAPANPASGVTS